MKDIINLIKKYRLPIIHITVTCGLIISFFFITKRFKPEPISDFYFYWLSVEDLSTYYKGGLLFLLYLPFRALSISAYWSAFIVNSLLYLGLSYILWLKAKTKLQLICTFTLLLCGIWFAGFIPIVNSDIPTIIFILLSIKIYIEAIQRRKKILYLISFFCMVIALTMRSLFLFSFLLLFFSLLLLYVFGKSKKKNLKNFLFFLFLSITFSFIINWGLELQSNNYEEIQIHKRITFYTGLIESHETERCGRWTIEGREATKNDLEKPMSQILISEYKSIGIKKAKNIILCKWENYLFNHNQSTVGWLRAHLNQNDKKNLITKNSNILRDWDYIEGFSVRILKILSTFFFLKFLYEFNKKSKLQKSVFFSLSSVLLFFFIVHTIMEIQPRYLISPIIFCLVVLLYLEKGTILLSEEIK